MRVGDVAGVDGSVVSCDVLEAGSLIREVSVRVYKRREIGGANCREEYFNVAVVLENCWIKTPPDVPESDGVSLHAATSASHLSRASTSETSS